MAGEDGGGCSARRQAELASQGWTRRLLAGEPRLSEAVQEYRDLGFEVRLEEVDPAACQGEGRCAVCFEQPQAAARLKIVFTRPEPRR